MGFYSSRLNNLATVVYTGFAIFCHLTLYLLTSVRLSEDNQRRSQVKLGSAADFSLDINETDLSLLSASIRSPSGREEPCLLKRMANNHIGKIHKGTFVTNEYNIYRNCSSHLQLFSPPHRYLLHPPGSGRAPGQHPEEWSSCRQQSHHHHGRPVWDWRRQSSQSSRWRPRPGNHLQQLELYSRHAGGRSVSACSKQCIYFLI